MGADYLTGSDGRTYKLLITKLEPKNFLDTKRWKLSYNALDGNYLMTEKKLGSFEEVLEAIESDLTYYNTSYPHRGKVKKFIAELRLDEPGPYRLVNNIDEIKGDEKELILKTYRESKKTAEEKFKKDERFFALWPE